MLPLPSYHSTHLIRPHCLTPPCLFALVPVLLLLLSSSARFFPRPLVPLLSLLPPLLLLRLLSRQPSSYPLMSSSSCTPAGMTRQAFSRVINALVARGMDRQTAYDAVVEQVTAISHLPSQAIPCAPPPASHPPLSLSRLLSSPRDAGPHHSGDRAPGSAANCGHAPRPPLLLLLLLNRTYTGGCCCAYNHQRAQGGCVGHQHLHQDADWPDNPPPCAAV